MMFCIDNIDGIIVVRSDKMVSTTKGIDVAKGLKVYCDRGNINKKLDGRRIQWLVDKMNENGYKIEYKALVQLLNNRSDWKLIYAVGICYIFKARIGDLFYLSDDYEIIDIDFV